ncbi:MAG: cyclic nucleotide-binding/CBS domain-containing protein [Acidimicrobiia bacterium]
MKLRSLVAGSGAEVCGPEVTLQEAAETMDTQDIGSIAVVDGPRLAGILTERDIVRASAAGADVNVEIARDWMTADPDTFSPEVQVAEAALWLLETGYRHLPVVEDGDLLGIVSVRDVLWVLAAPGSESTTG